MGTGLRPAPTSRLRMSGGLATSHGRQLRQRAQQLAAPAPLQDGVDLDPCGLIPSRRCCTPTKRKRAEPRSPSMDSLTTESHNSRMRSHASRAPHHPTVWASPWRRRYRARNSSSRPGGVLRRKTWYISPSVPGRRGVSGQAQEVEIQQCGGKGVLSAARAPRAESALP